MVCLFIAYLTFSFKYSSIANYVSAVWRLHDWFELPCVARNSFSVKSALLGAKRILGNKPIQCLPLLPKHLTVILGLLDLKLYMNMCFFAMVCLSFRCLLRKCHVTSSNHNLGIGDICFTPYGMDVILRSSKTNQFHESDIVIPVVRSASVLCPVRLLARYLKTRPDVKSDVLFVDARGNAITYNYYCSRLKELCSLAGFKGYYASHSLRRGGALFLNSIGMPLHDIQVYGNWRSLSVLLYLSGSKATRAKKDIFVAKALARY